MNYIPDIIPRDKRVLTEHFLRQSSQSTNNQVKGVAFRYLVASILFILSILSAAHFIVCILIAASALLLLPKCKAWLERNLVFKLTFKITAATVSVLLMSAAGIDKVYRDQDAIVQRIAKAESEAKDNERIIREKRQQQRLDSVRTFISGIENLVSSNKYEQALEQYGLAISATQSPDELKLLTYAQQETEYKQGIYLTKRKKYKLAIPILSRAISRNRDGLLYYSRGLCYSKLGQISEAVSDLRSAAGYPEADKLHEQINPLRKRVSYYVTRCCDGSTSGAKGRGACSHHHGVCNWNDPVYEYYRKY